MVSITVQLNFSYALSFRFLSFWQVLVENGARSQLALDTETKEIVGVHVGKRSREGAFGLWQSLPALYRQCAVCYTDLWSATSEIFPQFRHQAVGKNRGKTNSIERFNCTLRQRVSRLVRKTLSFSKKLENHIGAIWYFIHRYNELLRL